MGINAEQHTPTPWKFDRLDHMLKNHPDAVVCGDKGQHVTDFVKPADARRIVACVNACEGISTDELEAVATNADDVFRLRMLAHYATFRALTNDAREHLADDVAKPHESAASA
jgi:hypothetical protein